MRTRNEIMLLLPLLVLLLPPLQQTIILSV
jgi:hypothetical protein